MMHIAWLNYAQRLCVQTLESHYTFERKGERKEEEKESSTTLHIDI
jgi:hypothetical protein